MKQLLESGVHFGHQTRRWNPKMKPYIFAERGGIHIIDLQQTTALLDKAYDFVRNVASRGGTVLFVGTKKQCQEVVREEASRVGMPYVSHRWLGGLLTNFATIELRINRIHELRKLKEEGQLGLLPTKERMAMERELEKLEVNLGGVSNMTRLPAAVFVSDPKREAIATKEVTKLGIPLIGLVDTNCDPDEVDYVIPGNDDAIRSCGLIIRTLARAVEEGRQKVQIAEFLAAEQAREAAAVTTAAAVPYSPETVGSASRSPRGSRPGGGPGGDRGPGGGQRGSGGQRGPGGFGGQRDSSGPRSGGGRPGGAPGSGAARTAPPARSAAPRASALKPAAGAAEALRKGAVEAPTPIIETPVGAVETPVAAEVSVAVPETPVVQVEAAATSAAPVETPLAVVETPEAPAEPLAVKAEASEEPAEADETKAAAVDEKAADAEA
jgi:small subunit ribosomal protein S2